MDWLRQYAYVAAWLSPIVALLGMLIRGGGQSGEIEWAKMMLYIGFLSCLAATFTPALEPGARIFAGGAMSVMGTFFMFEVDADAGLKRSIQRKHNGIEGTETEAKAEKNVTQIAS